jgi:histidine triad (HIT) family protein
VSDCLFCKIINKEIPAKIAFENEHVVAFHDVNPQAPVHVLIVPKKHVEGLAELEKADNVSVGACILAAKKLVKDLKIVEGARLVVNQGPRAGQSIFHLHFHLLGGRDLVWPPG